MGASHDKKGVGLGWDENRFFRYDIRAEIVTFCYNIKSLFENVNTTGVFESS